MIHLMQHATRACCPAGAYVCVDITYYTPHAACHTRMLPLRGFYKSHISTSGAKGVYDKNRHPKSFTSKYILKLTPMVRLGNLTIGVNLRIFLHGDNVL